MKTVFADTGYWEATLNPRDQLNAIAKSVSKELGEVKIVTTEMVLDELLAALAGLATRVTTVRAVEAIIANPNVEVVPQTSIQFREALKLYRDRPDKEWSLTDCASFSLMTERGIREALAHDQHSEQAGFAALLRR
jgi:uncharacterized protein